VIALLEQHRERLAELCQRYHVARLEVFGSAAESEADADARDIDLLVEFDPKHDLGPWMHDYFALRDELQALFARPVDLVMPSGMRNPYFIREVNRTRRLLYAA
jgi:predicted nucleotidyltransferase